MEFTFDIIKTTISFNNKAFRNYFLLHLVIYTKYNNQIFINELMTFF